MLAGRFDDGASAELAIEPERRYWVQIAKGAVEINGKMTEAGDGVAIEDEGSITIRAAAESEILLFDLP